MIYDGMFTCIHGVGLFWTPSLSLECATLGLCLFGIPFFWVFKFRYHFPLLAVISLFPFGSGI